MNANIGKSIRLAAAAMAVAAIGSSCSTATTEAWAKIQTEGLIPYLLEDQSKALPVEQEVAVRMVPESSGTGSNRKQQSRPSLQLHEVGVVTAQVVDGKPGFVYSPHTSELLEIDVREYQAGARVRCPYTKKSFMIPVESEPSVSGTMVAARSSATESGVASVSKKQVNREMPVRATVQPEVVAVEEKIELVAPMELEPMVVKVDEEEQGELEPKPVKIPKTGNVPPPNFETLALPAPVTDDAPVGKRVPGKPNYVYSPFAASNQVVDVEGHAAGTKVKCPYTGKVFAVPGAETEAESE